MSVSLPSLLRGEHDGIQSSASGATESPPEYTVGMVMSGPFNSQSTGFIIWRIDKGLCVVSPSGMSGPYVLNGSKAISDIFERRTRYGNSDDPSQNDLFPENLLQNLGQAYFKAPGEKTLQTKLGDLVCILQLAPSLLDFGEKLMDAYVSEEHLEAA